MSSPAFQFYVKQWLGDDAVMLMDWDARGMHLHFMCIAWQQDDPCTLPDDDDVLRKWVGNPRQWERLKKQIFLAWKLKNGRWVQDGLLKEWEKQHKFSKSRSDNAKKRWSGHKKNNSDDASAMQVDMQVQCSSSSSSDNKDGNKKTLPSYVMCDDVIDYLNEKCGKHFRHSDTNRTHIRSRLKEGFSIEDCKNVIDIKLSDKYFIENTKFYNPQTLFRKSNFERYLQEDVNKKPVHNTGKQISCPRCGKSHSVDYTKRVVCECGERIVW